MNYNETVNILGNVDIYIIDQILKNRYGPNDIILDAGCGEGRNLKWFYKNQFSVFGIDADIDRIENAKTNYPLAANNFKVGNLSDLPYKEASFHHLFCNAVLHFANSESHFSNMFSELIRVLKPNGSLLIRMASNIGLNDDTPYVKDGKTNTQSNFYLTRAMIYKLTDLYNIELIEPVKTTNVADIRAMTTLVFCKL